MKFVRAALASLLLCTALPGAAQQRADAALIVNSASPAYAEAQRHVRLFLDHLGVPYTTLDLATTPVTADISRYALIIIGHPSIDTTGTLLTEAAQQNILNAVALGTGLVNFDHDLAVNRVGRYTFVQQIFGFGYGWATSGEGVLFTDAAPGHYITSRHAAGEYDPFRVMNAASVVPPDGATVLARFYDSRDPFIVTTTYGFGRAIQWASSEWMSPSQYHGDVRGGLQALDDVLWRSLAWAARKPFVMRGLPPFVTMRVDDVAGNVNRPLDGLWWAGIANQFGLKPWMGTFWDALGGPDSITLAHLVIAGNATTSVHGQKDGPFWFDHLNQAPFPDDVFAGYVAAAEQWHTNYNIPISKVVVPHFYEIGTNTFATLARWGVKSLALPVAPGTVYGDTSPWLELGPFRRWEAGTASTMAAFTYADYIPYPADPQYDGTFFDCMTEIRDDPAIYEWKPDSTDVQVTIDRGTRQTKRALDSMALATLFTHEYYIQAFKDADWISAVSTIAKNIAPYHPVYVTLDDACEYLRAKHDTTITSSVYDPATGQLSTALSGHGDVATKFLVFTEAGGFMQQVFWDVPAFDGVATVTSVVQVSAPTVSSVDVSPSTASLATGATQQLAATATYSEGTTVTVTTQATWASSNAAVATVSATGLVSGVGPGTATISATLSGVSGATSAVTVFRPPLSVTTSALAAAVRNVPYSASLAAVGGLPPYAWSTSSTLPAGLSLASDGTLSGTPTASGAFSVVATVTDSSAATASATLALTVSSAQDVSLWPLSTVPGTADNGPGSPVELGVKFRSDAAGTIGGVRFYKSALNTGIHTANLWTSTGTLLASATFTSETASGWQEVRFATPVAIAANTVYVASYHTDTGHFARDAGYFTNASRDTTPLHAPAASAVGGNGVFAYGASSVFPDGTTQVDANYWVDVVFSASDPPTLTAIALTPTNPIVDVGSAVALKAMAGFSDGASYDISGQVLWTSSSAAVASVDPFGLATALSPGTSTITASYAAPGGSVSGSTTLTAAPVLTTIVVSPASARLLAGGTRQFTAAGYDAQGNPMPGLTFTWSAGAGGTISATGLFTAGTTGGAFTGNVVAHSGSVSGAASAEVVGVASVALAPASVTGGASSTGTVTLSGAAPAGGAQVALSSDTAGVTVPASVTVAEGQTTATFTISTSVVAAATTATIGAGLGGSAGSASLTVAPAAVTGLTLSPASVIGGASVTGTVTVAGAAPAAGLVVTLASDTSGVTVPATATVAAGQTSATFTVTTSPVAADTTATVTATLGTTSAQGVLAIAAPALSGMSANPGSVTGGSTSSGTVTLNGPAPSGGIVVSLASGNTSAATVPTNVTVASGATSAGFTITTTPVAADVSVTISGAISGGAAQSSLLTVAAPRIASVTFNPTAVTGTRSSIGTVTLTGNAPPGGTTVSLTSDSASATVPTSVTVAAATQSVTFSASTAAVGSVTTANVAATLNGSATVGVLTINPATIQRLQVTATVITGGATTSGSIRLSVAAPSGGAVVSLSSSSPVATVPASVTIAAGQLVGSFTVATTPVSVDTAATIAASYQGSTASIATVVTPPLLQSVGVAQTTIAGGTSTTGTVTLDGAAPAGGVAVTLASDSAVATVPASVTVPAGAYSATFTVRTTVVTASTTVTVSATAAGAPTRTTTLTVARASLASVSMNPTVPIGGWDLTGTVTLTGNAPTGGLVVTLADNSGYAGTPASVTVLAGRRTATFTVTTLPVSANTPVTFTATLDGVTTTASVIITPPFVSSVSLSPSTVTGGSTSTATVTLSGLAPAGGMPVELFADSLVSVATSVTVPAGSSTTTFTVTTTAATSGSAKVSASAGGLMGSATLTITQ